MKISCILLLLLPAIALAQMNNPEAKRKPYGMGATELIFSSSQVKDSRHSVDAIVRFSAFFHVAQQIHVDFGRTAGFYTGWGIRNVGFINRLDDSVKIKQRSYSLGIPLALKIGNMEKQVWLAAGAEAGLMFAYKQKVFYAGEKFKDHEWFSDKVNIFNPSVFAEIHFRKGGYIKAKYYLNNFLKKDKQEIKLFGTLYPYSPESSKMFYISIGTAVKNKDAKRRLNRQRDRQT